MFLKTEAIVLSRGFFSNTSLWIVFCTRRAGRFSVLAKGVFRWRRKAEPPSVPDLFSRGELVAWVGRSDKAALLRDWTLEDMRTGLRSDWGAFFAAGSCALLAGKLAPPGEVSSGLYDLLDEALDALDANAKKGGSPGPVLWSFALRALYAGGFLAEPSRCASCGGRFGPGGPAGLIPEEGGLVCQGCAGGRPGARMSPEARKALSFLAATGPAPSRRLKVSRAAGAELGGAVRALSEHILGERFPFPMPGAEAGA